MTNAHPDEIVILTSDAHFAQALEPHLKSHGYHVRVIDRVASIIQALESHPPDFLLIDRRTPDRSELLGVEAFRATPHMVIQLPGYECTEEECVDDLERGFDIVLCDQTFRQIIARIRAILRRADGVSERTERLVVGWLSLDLARHEVTVEGHAIDLTYMQFRILEVMMREPGRAFTRNDLLAKIWGEGIAVQDRTLDVHIHALRKKLVRDSNTPSILQTLRGFGYRLKLEA